MVSKWVITVMTCLQMEYIGVITHFLTIDPNFLGHPRRFLSVRKLEMVYKIATWLENTARKVWESPSHWNQFLKDCPRSRRSSKPLDKCQCLSRTMRVRWGGSKSGGCKASDSGLHQNPQILSTLKGLRRFSIAAIFFCCISVFPFFC